MGINGKQKLFFSLVVIFFISGFVLLNQARAQEAAKNIRIVISTSGPVKFTSHYLDNPSRLVIKFKSRNILSNIDKEVAVEGELVKKITSSYYDRGRVKPLRQLTFELAQEVPYKIWQEDNSIILDIQAQLGEEAFAKEVAALSSIFGASGDSSSKGKAQAIVQRLAAMDTALNQVAPAQLPLELTEPEAVKIEEGETDQAQAKEVLPEVKAPLVVEPPKVEKSMEGAIIWLASLGLISGLGFLSWRRWRLNIEDKLKAELAEKIKYAEIEENLRKAIEQSSKQKEEECEQLKGSLESLTSKLQEKDKIYEELRDSFQLLKEKLAQKKLKEKKLSPEEERISWEADELARGGKRKSPRLPLTRDFNKTIILRVNSLNLPRSIKCFAKNVSAGGLCFETKQELEEKEPINLRLFFYGGQASSMKIQAHIVWRRKTESMNEYGVSFELLDEKESLELNRYIEAKKEELVPVREVLC